MDNWKRDQISQFISELSTSFRSHSMFSISISEYTVFDTAHSSSSWYQTSRRITSWLATSKRWAAFLKWAALRVSSSTVTFITITVCFSLMTWQTTISSLKYSIDAICSTKSTLLAREILLWPKAMPCSLMNFWRNVKAISTFQPHASKSLSLHGLSNSIDVLLFARRNRTKPNKLCYTQPSTLMFSVSAKKTIR